MTSGPEYAVELEQTFDALLALYDQLASAEIEDAVIDEEWTPKTLMAHVAFWDDFQTRRMEDGLAGASAVTGVTWPADDNDARLQRDRSRDWHAILADARTNRRRMIDFAQRLDDEALAVEYPEGKRTLSLDRLLRHMVNHTVEHTQQLHAFVQARSG